jgi:YfiH family protein
VVIQAGFAGPLTRFLVSPLLSGAGFRHGFPTRGTADAEWLEAMGAPSIVQVRQVHGARAVLASDAAGAEADAIVARAEGAGDVGAGALAIGVRVADCVPVLVASLDTGDAAAIHAGWRGVVGGVVGSALELLGGAERERIACIGPCIGACCFEVGAEVAERPGLVSFVVFRSGEKAYVDLRAAVRAQLVAAGVKRIEDVPGCTKHEPERFHSFRRDGAESGRMLAAIAPRTHAPARGRGRETKE